MAMNLLNRLFQGASSDRLNHELMTLVHNDEAVANRLVTFEKQRNPGHTEPWYLEKVIYDLRR